MDLPSSLSSSFSFRIAGNRSSWASRVEHEMCVGVPPHRPQSMKRLRCRHELDPIDERWKMNSHIYMIWWRPRHVSRISGNFSQSHDFAPFYLDCTAPYTARTRDTNLFEFAFRSNESILYFVYDKYSTMCQSLVRSFSRSLALRRSRITLSNWKHSSASVRWVMQVTGLLAWLRAIEKQISDGLIQCVHRSPSASRWKPTNIFTRI